MCDLSEAHPEVGIGDSDPRDPQKFKNLGTGTGMGTESGGRGQGWGQGRGQKPLGQTSRGLRLRGQSPGQTVRGQRSLGHRFPGDRCPRPPPTSALGALERFEALCGALRRF